MKNFNNTPLIATTIKGKPQNDQKYNTRSYYHLLDCIWHDQAHIASFISLLREYTILNSRLISEYSEKFPASFWKEEQILRKLLFQQLTQRGLI